MKIFVSNMAFITKIPRQKSALRSLELSQFNLISLVRAKVSYQDESIGVKSKQYILNDKQYLDMKKIKFVILLVLGL